MVLISVITVNRNNAAGLEKTIHSVVSQDFRDFEFIVIDGDSTDQSKNILSANNSRITFQVSEPDTGIYNAMNKGIRASKARYLLFLNSGDTLFNNRVLSEAANSLSDADLVSGDIISRDRDGLEKLERSPQQAGLKEMITGTLWHPSTFIKRELFEKLGYYNESYRIAADYDFFVRAVLVAKCSYRHLNLPVAYFELDGLSNQPSFFDLMINERKQIQKSWFTSGQLDAAHDYDIVTTGRASRFFRLVPDVGFFKAMYDKMYYFWYKRGMNK